jgi:hypothetical protein
MALNFEQLNLFVEGLKITKVQEAENKTSFEDGQNGRLYSENGKLSFSSIKGTVELYNNVGVVKYLGYFAFADKLVLLVKADKVSINTVVTTRDVFIAEDITVSIPYGSGQFLFNNELSVNARTETQTFITPEVLEPDSPLQDNYEEVTDPETINLEDFYSFAGVDVPNYEVCSIQSSSFLPEYNKTYSDAIIVLTKESNNTLSSAVRWHGNMNWDINRKITTVGIFENNYYQRVYLTDNINDFRVFNLMDKNLSFRTANEFSVRQKSPLLQPIIKSIQDEGSVKAMRVQYAHRLITDNGQVTSYSPYSEMIEILKNSDGSNFKGGDVGEITSKSVTIKIPIIATGFTEVQCIALEYEGNVGSPTSIRDLGRKSIQEVIEFTHTGTESEFAENFTVEEIIETHNSWAYCNDMTIKNNKIIAGGLRNVPFALQEKYVQDLFLFKGWNQSGETHNSLINPEPDNYNQFDPTNEDDSIFLRKQLYKRFLFFGTTTLTFKNKNIPGSEQDVTFTNSADQYLEYIEQVYNWLQALDLTDFPNLQITRSGSSILFSPIDENIETDFFDYVFETSTSQVIIDFDNEYGLLTPAINTSNLVWGAQSVGFNKGIGVRMSFKEKKEKILNAGEELYSNGDILDLETPSLNKTFVKNEVYRTSLQFFKDGNPLFAIVLGDVMTPAIGDDHKYISDSGIVINSDGNKYLNQSELITSPLFFLIQEKELLIHRLEARVEVRIPCEFKQFADSYQIQYVERTENNRTVLCQGISAPMIRMNNFGHPSESISNYAPLVSDKWTLPFNGGPLWSVDGLDVYDDPSRGENWEDDNLGGSFWFGSEYTLDEMSKSRELANRKMMYFDSPDLIHGLISSKKVSNGQLSIVGRVNTDHTPNLIRDRFPGQEIHENYVNFTPHATEDDYKSRSFSKKVGYENISGTGTSKPYHLNVSVFSKFTLYNAIHSIEKSEELSKGGIIPSAVLGTSFEASNNALTVFAQNAYNSGLWLSGFYDYGDDTEFGSQTHKSANRSEGYPTVLIRANEDVFTDDFIGPTIADPIRCHPHTPSGDAYLPTGGGIAQTDSHAIINIKFNNINSIYGGRNKHAYSKNVFIPLGKVIPIKGSESDNQAQVFDVQGDFYTSLFIRTKSDYSNPNEFKKHNMEQSPSGLNSKEINDWNRGGGWAYAVVLETEVESRLNNEPRFYRSAGSVDFSVLLAEFINSAYLKKNNLRVYSPVPFNFKDDPLMTNILSASNVKLSGDYIDAWTTFLVSEFYELEKSKGIITNVTSWQDEIFAIQEHETNRISIDGSDFITTDSGEQATVKKGDGGTFTSHKKVSDFGTSIRRALAEGEYGFSFYDERKNSFVKMAKPISLEKEIQLKFQELFENDRVVDTEGYYDQKYKETNIRVRTESGASYLISYNEVLSVFNGYYSYDNDLYIQFDERVFAPIRGTKTVTIETPLITSALVQANSNGVYLQYQITADNNPTEFSSDNLPAGLVIDALSGLIYGTITVSNIYNINISAKNESGTDTEILVLIIS